MAALRPVPRPRYGVLWCRAVLRPFAEQVVAALAPRTGQIVVDLGDDDGTTAGLLRRGGTEVRGAGGSAFGSPAPVRVAAVVAVRGGITTPPPLVGIEVAAALRAGQSLLCSWHSAPHEAALRRVFGMDPVAQAEAGSHCWLDVIRFDSVDHFWAAAQARADVNRQAESMSVGDLSAARQALGTLLAPYLTADATLRIPAVMAVR